MKQLEIAALMYADDNHELLPPSTNFENFLLDYVRNTDIFATRNPSGGEFEINPGLIGANIVKIPNPENTPLFHDSQPWSSSQHLVGFADGHVTMVSATEWQSLRQKWGASP